MEPSRYCHLAIQSGCPLPTRKRLSWHQAESSTRDTNSRQLYFAAYKDKIHVTIPRGLKQLLPGKPSLIVNLPRTLDGRRIGGTIDRTHPHFVNNILVGDLGSQEILLVACDDGDILAFYTHHMISGIIRGARGDIIKPYVPGRTISR